MCRLTVDVDKPNGGYLDAQTAEIATISARVEEIERRMAEYKALEAEQKAVKSALFEAMDRHGVKS